MVDRSEVAGMGMIDVVKGRRVGKHFIQLSLRNHMRREST